MGLKELASSDELKRQASSKLEIDKLLEKIDEYENEIENINAYSIKLTIAYDISRLIATIALRVMGYRVAKPYGHHKITIDSLEHTLKAPKDLIRSFQDIRKKRNNTSYDGDIINEADVREAVSIAKELKELLMHMLKKNYPEYLE